MRIVRNALVSSVEGFFFSPFFFKLLGLSRNVHMPRFKQRVRHAGNVNKQDEFYFL